jgi:iron(III) transport system substrate-binding protein
VRKISAIALLSALSLLLTTACSSQSDQAQELTIYSGRSENFISPFFTLFTEQSGIKLNIRYGDSAELAAQILEEGSNSPADLFLAQDAGSLGAVAAQGLFAPIDADIAAQIPAKFSQADRQWVGVTARVRVFAYDPNKVSVLPKSISDLTKPIYKNQIGIAPTNASFQAFLTAVIDNKGREFAKTWLQGLKNNGVKIYPKNSVIVEAIDKGEISIGLVNHYYTWEVAEALGREINAVNGYFQAGDLGNLINVSGIGILNSSDKKKAAADLVEFLTSASTQAQFVDQTHEYSLIETVAPDKDLPTLTQIGAPSIDLGSLKNIKATQDLLIEVGLL